jgi:hypothetical protein
MLLALAIDASLARPVPDVNSKSNGKNIQFTFLIGT